MENISYKYFNESWTFKIPYFSLKSPYIKYYEFTVSNPCLSQGSLLNRLFGPESVIVHDKKEVMRGLVEHYCESARFSKQDKVYMIDLYLDHEYDELQRFIDSVLYV